MKCVKNVSMFLCALAACAAVFGQSGDFTVSGRVLVAGQPFQGATITYNSISHRLSWDFSRADGTFGGPTAVLPQGPDDRITLPADGPVTVDIFDVGGKKITTVSGKLDKGTYLLQPFSAKLAQAMYLLKIKAGDRVTYQKLLSTGNSKGGIAIAASTSNVPGVLAKKFAGVDSIRVGRTGYTPVYIAINTYGDNVGDVTLTPINIEGEVTTLFGQMTTLQKIGQLCMPPTPIAAATVASNNCGSVFGGGGALVGSSPSSAATMVDGFQTAMMGTTLKIPILAAYDFVHGASAVPGATMLPHNMALGAIQDTLLIQKAFRVQALEVRGSGCNWGFGPCIAVIRDDRWGRAYEGFSETPDRTQIMARHAVLGIQTTDLSLPTAYVATCKHFAGDGNTANGVNMGETVGPDATARAINLPGYASAVATGVGCIMPSFSQWCDGTPMHTNATLMNGWLKSTTTGNPGFQGFIVGDWDAANPLQTSIAAGLDVPMAPEASTGIIGTINGFYAANQARIDDAVKRVLRVKYWMNLFAPSQYMTNRALTALVGCADHRMVARECVRASLVLLKDTNAVLPIPKSANVAIWGQGGSDVGIQCGGWTVSWQGQAGAIPGGGGTTILQGAQATCTGTVTYSNNGSNSGNADYIIAVLSELPYAEVSFTDISLTNDAPNVGPGPNTNMATSTNSAVMTAIQTAHAAGKKVIGVLMAGRPLDISTVLPNCDAFVWASLPGSEGNGITDVLFGDYNFTGKLALTWPKASGQLQTDVGTTRTNGLFAYGYGLSY